MLRHQGAHDCHHLAHRTARRAEAPDSDRQAIPCDETMVSLTRYDGDDAHDCRRALRVARTRRITSTRVRVAELSRRARQVRGDGGGAQPELVRHELVTETERDELDDLGLPQGELGPLARARFVRARDDEAPSIALEAVDQRPAPERERMPRVESARGVAADGARARAIA